MKKIFFVVLLFIAISTIILLAVFHFARHQTPTLIVTNHIKKKENTKMNRIDQTIAKQGNTEQEKVSDEEQEEISDEEIEEFLAFLDSLAEEEQDSLTELPESQPDAAENQQRIEELKKQIAEIKNYIREVDRARNSQNHEWACRLQVLKEIEKECEGTREQHPSAYPGVRRDFEEKVAEFKAWEAGEHAYKIKALNEELQGLLTLQEELLNQLKSLEGS